ncbi:MAG TPA: hypothetical protein VHY48_10380 [Acidobacteriaceae bacterium]|nr:hypothetical protein [Acidobacteriaceae bacterium]
MQDRSLEVANVENQIAAYSNLSLPLLEALVSQDARAHLVRMFRDPYVLEPGERTELIDQLRRAVAVEPKISGLRVLLGMTLCVNLEVQDALEELRDAVRLAPDNFIARLKLGELLMRLRICSEAADETLAAAKLAATSMQAELARRQAETIRTMQREGIERGGYHKLRSTFSRTKRWFLRSTQRATALTSR